MKRLLLVIFILWASHSCVVDTVYNCIIQNNTNDKVQIKVLFDKHTLDSLYRGQEYFSYLKNNVGQDSGVLLNELDTVIVAGFYTLNPKSHFTIEHGMSGPDYSFYKDIVIVHNKNTIIFHDKDEIKEAFKYDKGNYVLTVK